MYVGTSWDGNRVEPAADADGGAVKVGVLLFEVDMELPDSRYDGWVD
jgi:hypothetical protein